MTIDKVGLVCSADTCRRSFCDDCIAVQPELPVYDASKWLCWCCKRQCQKCAPEQNKEIQSEFSQLLELERDMYQIERRAFLLVNRISLRKRLQEVGSSQMTSPFALLQPKQQPQLQAQQPPPQPQQLPPPANPSAASEAVPSSSSSASASEDAPMRVQIQHTEVLPPYQYYVPLRRNYYEEDYPVLEFYPQKLSNPTHSEWLQKEYKTKFPHLRKAADNLTYLENRALAELIKLHPLTPQEELRLVVSVVLEKNPRAVTEWIGKHHQAYAVHVQPPTLETLSSTFERFLCPMCFTFNCNLHDGAVRRQPPARSFALQPSARPCKFGATCHLNNNNNSAAASLAESTLPKFTALESELTCKMLLKSLPGAYCDVGMMMQKNCSSIKAFALANDIAAQPPLRDGPPPRRTREKLRLVDSHRRDAHTHPQYEPTYYDPCSHAGPCTAESNCCCAKGNDWCEKWCACYIAGTCNNVFPGCTCKSGCVKELHCFCLSANRECDPELCECDCGEADCTKRTCKNAQILHNSSKRVYVGKSAIHGWGLILGEPVKQGDLIVEYFGEIITEDEADRRGAVYDRQGHSFLFNFCDGFAIDSARKGNRAKFINHCKRANIRARTVFSGGNWHIPFYAIRDISTGEELLFDYGYPEEFTNRFLTTEGPACEEPAPAAAEDTPYSETGAKRKKGVRKKKSQKGK